MANDFSVGDVVQLKSGGVQMTVEEIVTDEVRCVWFEGKKAERNSFPAATLKKYVPITPGVIRTRPYGR